MSKGKGLSAKRVRSAPRMDGEIIPPAKRRAQWSRAFKQGGENVLSYLNECAMTGQHPAGRHSDGKQPWQLALADYEVRFSENNPRGGWGIYLRDYNVCVATFADNSDALRDALSAMFDAANALSESSKIISGHYHAGPAKRKRKAT